MTIECTQYALPKSDGILPPECVEMNRSQLDLITNITRYTLLCSMAIMAKSVSLAVYTVFLVLNEDGAMEQSLFHLFNKWLFVPVLFIEILSIWLTFGFNTDSYWNCCNGPHHFCQRRCTKLAEHKLRQHIVRLQKINSHHDSCTDLPSIGQTPRLGGHKYSTCSVDEVV